ncbi:unnamed protein product [Cylicocyclus nassatus]|uniref:Uncharacterized protein n=1 Tax=Cylicocyclus nassatus TaxID=53992 RepID=A0AA36H726_CYLNA|nr:unnamed protein product [Cylicocyclus nassatus]
MGSSIVESLKSNCVVVCTRSAVRPEKIRLRNNLKQQRELRMICWQLVQTYNVRTPLGDMDTKILLKGIRTTNLSTSPHLARF